MQYDSMLEFGEASLVNLGEEAEIIIGAELEVPAEPPVSRDTYINMVRSGTVALTGETATDVALEFRLKGATTSGGGLTVLMTHYLGKLSEIEARKGPILNAVLPVGVADYPFLKAYIYNMDAAKDVLTGAMKAWIGAPPDAHLPLLA